MEDSLTKVAVAVPGSLGIILAIATFIFMAWLVRYVFKTNDKREERLARLIEVDLVNQKMQLDRLEEGHKFQRIEHQTIISNQGDFLKKQESIALLLERLLGLVTGNKSSKVS